MVVRYKSSILGIDLARPGGEGGGCMTTVIEHARGHYETRSMPYGKAYVWCPERVLVECECGETPILTASESVCQCGADHESLVGENTAFGNPQHETLHPWEQEYREWRERLAAYLRSEEPYQQEWDSID